MEELIIINKIVEMAKAISKKDPNECVSEEISHLIKEKDYEQKRAIAAAYNICKHPNRRSTNKSV